MAKVNISHELCKGCELCVIACPKKILTIADRHNTKGYAYATVTDDNQCIGCCRCVKVCPDICFEIRTE